MSSGLPIAIDANVLMQAAVRDTLLRLAAQTLTSALCKDGQKTTLTNLWLVRAVVPCRFMVANPMTVKKTRLTNRTIAPIVIQSVLKMSSWWFVHCLQRPTFTRNDGKCPK